MADTLTVSVDSALARPHHLTPREVLSWLPPGATPAQMDSAIQRHIQPSEIHWSEQPDTLHLPGWPAGRSIRDARLPQYYRQSFFSANPMLHPELPGGRPGVTGDPLPYSMASDDFFVSILLLCLILTTLVFTRSRHFVGRELKNILYARHDEGASTETSTEVRAQVLLLLQTSLMAGLCLFFYTDTSVGGIFTVSPYGAVGIYTGLVAASFALRALLYEVADWVFFDRRRNLLWQKSALLISSLEGIGLVPVVMLHIFFGLSLETTLWAAAVVVCLFKILLSFRAYTTFFRQETACMQMFLYLCTLEIAPLLYLWGALVFINGYLKINF